MEETLYYIIPYNLTDSLDFSQILETSKETLRLSVDKTKAIVKTSKDNTYFTLDRYENCTPYTYSEILELIQTEEWTEIKTY